MDDFPAIKWFSSTDRSGTFPTPVTCTRVERAVAGVDYRTWAGWFKLARYLDLFP